MKRITMALTLLMLSAHEVSAACPGLRTVASKTRAVLKRVVTAPARLMRPGHPSPPLFVPAPATLPLPMPAPAPKKASFQFFTSSPSGGS